MKQEYNQYTDEHQKVWQILFERQQKNLIGKAIPEYLYCLNELQPVFNGQSIPKFDEVNELLLNKTGWQINVVPGLIPAADFLSLLADKKFCSSTWLRTMDQLNYLEEPDMFHDAFGHIPLLMDPKYALFMQKLGELGMRFKDNSDVIALLERFYWYTVEFGLVSSDDTNKIYGAGIISSFQETNSIYESQTVIHAYDLEDVLDHTFVKDTLQAMYYALDSSVETLYTSFKKLEDAIETKFSLAKTETVIQ